MLSIIWLSDTYIMVLFINKQSICIWKIKIYIINKEQTKLLHLLDNPIHLINIFMLIDMNVKLLILVVIIYMFEVIIEFIGLYYYFGNIIFEGKYG